MCDKPGDIFCSIQFNFIYVAPFIATKLQFKVLDNKRDVESNYNIWKQYSKISHKLEHSKTRNKNSKPFWAVKTVHNVVNK